jgi:hypothetical protein
MRRLILGLAAVAVIALACGTALADHGHRGGHQRYGYGNSYRGGYSYSWNGSYGWGGYGRFGNSFSEAARDVREAHSRYGFNTHPRSYYNAPDYRYYYWRW